MQVERTSPVNLEVESQVAIQEARRPMDRVCWLVADEVVTRRYVLSSRE